MKTWVHLSYDSKRTKKILLFFLFLLFGYGFYKNGLSYFFFKMMSFSDALKPLWFVLIGIFCSAVSFLLFRKKDFYSLLIEGILVGLLPPPSFPLHWFFIYTFFFLLLARFWERKTSLIPMMLFYKVGLIGFTSLFQIGLQNVIEQTTPYYYGTIDVVLGRGLGGVGTTSIFLVVLLFGFLGSDFYYKKEISISAFFSYTFLFFLFFFLHPESYLLQDYFNPSFFFTIVLFLPRNASSPATKMAGLFYGVGVGILSYFLIHCFSIQEGAYLSLFLIYFLFLLLHFLWLLRQKKNVK